jgi:hypothetical protein
MPSTGALQRGSVEPSRRGVGKSAGSPNRAHNRGFRVILAAQVLVAAAVAAGWAASDDRWLVPHEGLGYALGICGLGLMTLLLGYPLRKRVRLMRGWGRVGTWFEIHMLLGLLGPLAILYHANFRLGSLNANIALACVLTVAGSGVIGRVIYVRIHEGLSGRRKTLAGVREALEATRLHLEIDGDGATVIDELVRFEHRVLGDRADSIPRARAALTLPWRYRATRRSAFKVLQAGRKTRGKMETKLAKRAVLDHLKAVRNVARFTVYERLFALWHVAHLPLTFLLFATAAAHVVAVHMY